MSIYDHEEPPPFDTAGPRVPALSPLAREITEYLQKHPGFITMATICGAFIKEKGYPLKQLNEALRQLHHEGITSVCHSCYGLISETTCHEGTCSHGS